MKKYTSRAVKSLAIASLICCMVLLIGIALLFAKVKNIGLPIGLIMFGGLLGILFLACFFAEKSRALLMDSDKIILPRGAMINGKSVWQKAVIKTADILSVERRFHKGKGFVSGDTYFYSLKLRDDRKVTVTLYAYGKQEELEIFEALKKFSV